MRSAAGRGRTLSMHRTPYSTRLASQQQSASDSDQVARPIDRTDNAAVYLQDRQRRHTSYEGERTTGHRAPPLPASAPSQTTCCLSSSAAAANFNSKVNKRLAVAPLPFLRPLRVK
ncbi:hypothetical protein PGT21_037274 [Puccinia graminis f. sp. tritici]|uniref:Uncharacterized protein n=1 Tax=Puccinia graminis f. sp. tritici TaxID=56615 RepID=A0A5B0R3U5_PUCGR|nr:hypothetical protein PGT21_037274 [Puccinia graminis f. sp. tritici]